MIYDPPVRPRIHQPWRAGTFPGYGRADNSEVLALLKVPTMSTPNPAPAPPITHFINADDLVPILRKILADTDAWYASTRTHHGSEPRFDVIAAGLHDLLAEVQS